MPLRICGAFFHAITDVCVVEGRTKLGFLSVQEDKRYRGIGDPEPQIIVQTIAAFQDHNYRLSLANVAIVPRIRVIMVGSAPIFTS